MKVLVCGGRDYSNSFEMNAVLYKIHIERNITQIISGSARGADTMAIGWALLWNVDFEEFPANWDRYGRSAGPKRNLQMLEEGTPDLVVAFEGGNGTQNMIKQAKNHGVEVIEV